MMHKKINLYELAVLFMLWIPPVTLVQALLPFSLNRIVMFGVLACFLAMTLENPSPKALYFLLYLAFQSAMIAVISENLGKSVDDLIYFCGIFIELMAIASPAVRERLLLSFRRHRGLMTFIVALCEGILLLNLSLSGCYEYKWHEQYLIGWTAHQHTLASICCVLLVYVVFLARDWFKGALLPLALMVIPVYALLSAGSRTFLVPAALTITLFMANRFKKRWLSTLMIGVAAGVGVYNLAGDTHIAYKFTQAFDYRGTEYFSYILMSGRNEFWAIDLQAFSQLGGFDKWIGKGFDWVYSVNESQYGSYIWAHNDLLHILMGTGFCGLFHYLALLLSLFAGLRRSCGRFDRGVLFFYICFPMLFNGYYVYQHFVLGSLLLILYMSPDPERGDAKGAEYEKNRHCDLPQFSQLRRLPAGVRYPKNL